MHHTTKIPRRKSVAALSPHDNVLHVTNRRASDATFLRARDVDDTLDTITKYAVTGSNDVIVDTTDAVASTKEVITDINNSSACTIGAVHSNNDNITCANNTFTSAKDTFTCANDTFTSTNDTFPSTKKTTIRTFEAAMQKTTKIPRRKSTIAITPRANVLQVTCDSKAPSTGDMVVCANDAVSTSNDNFTNANNTVMHKTNKKPRRKSNTDVTLNTNFLSLTERRLSNVTFNRHSDIHPHECAGDLCTNDGVRCTNDDVLYASDLNSFINETVTVTNCAVNENNEAFASKNVDLAFIYEVVEVVTDTDDAADGFNDAFSNTCDAVAITNDAVISMNNGVQQKPSKLPRGRSSTAKTTHSNVLYETDHRASDPAFHRSSDDISYQHSIVPCTDDAVPCSNNTAEVGIDPGVLISYTKSAKMSVDTYCLDFHVVPCLEEAVYVRDVATVATCVAELLRQDCLEQGCIFSAYSYTAIYSGPKDSVFTIKHYFREGLVTLTIESFRISIEDALFGNYDEIEILQKHIRRTLDAEAGASIPAIRRCQSKSPYMRSSDDRIQQYKWEALLFNEQSPHQLVEIFSTSDYGNVLVLDGNVNIAESDLIYTQSLMCQGKQQYKDKEILILGGGDGALLYELLKESPKLVTMVDIDEAVIRGCSQHMKSICGDVLEKREGANYKVIVDDAFKWLKQYDEEGKQFDYIFGDLTEIPVHTEGTTWEFVRSILKLSLSLLPVGGKYMTHCNGKNSGEALDIFENEVKKIGYPLEIMRSEAYVPSFMETWVFFHLTRKEGVVNGIAGKEAKGEPNVTLVNGDVKKEQKGMPDKDVKEIKNEKQETKKEIEKDAKGRVSPEKESKVNGERKEAKTPSEKKDTSSEKKDSKAGVKNAKEKLESPKTDTPKATEKSKAEKIGKKKDAK